MMRRILQLLMVLGVAVLFSSMAVAAPEATIQPSDPDDITLTDSDSYEVTKEFDGTASTGSVTSYTWDLVDSSQSDTGPTAEFTFNRDSSSSNTIRLTVSNGTHSDVDEVTQVLHDVPNLSLSASSTSITEGNSVSFTSNITNEFDGPVTYEWDWGDGNSCSSGCSADESHTFSSTGTFTVNLTATDTADKTGYVTRDISVSSGDDDSGSSSSSSSSGGGGGGVGGGGVASERSKAFFDVTRGASVSVNVENSEQIGVKQINVTVDNPAQKVSITVTKEDGRPASVQQNVSGTAYRYMDIQAETTNGSTVGNATIRFDVNRSWMQDNNINKSRVFLNRYLNDTDEWERLPTRETGATVDSVEYTAETPDFSTFAVSGEENEEQEQVADEETTPTCGDMMCNGNETWESCSMDCSKPAVVAAAEASINDAEDRIDPGDAGYELLQQAHSAFDTGNYSSAETLAGEAVDAYEQAQPGLVDRLFNTSTILWFILALLVAVGIGLAYHWQHEDLGIEEEEPERAEIGGMLEDDEE